MKYAIDVEAFVELVELVVKIEPEYEFSPGDDAPPRQKMSSVASGSVPKWVAYLVMSDPDGFGNPEVVQVKFAAERPPEFEPKSVMQVNRLWANAWSMGSKSGTTIAAEGLSFRPAGKPAAKAVKTAEAAA